MFPCDWCLCVVITFPQKKKISTYMLPRDQSCLQFVWLPCDTKWIPVIMFSCAGEMISMQEAVDSTFQTCFWLGEVFELFNPTPPRPTVAPDFLYFVGKDNMCVYFSVLIRQWSSLCPDCPLLWDKGTSKASVVVVGAAQEDEAMDLLSDLLPLLSKYHICQKKKKKSLRDFAFSESRRFLSVSRGIYFLSQIFSLLLTMLKQFFQNEFITTFRSPLELLHSLSPAHKLWAIPVGENNDNSLQNYNNINENKSLFIHIHIYL